jgi:hypothetical protein
LPCPWSRSSFDNVQSQRKNEGRRDGDCSLDPAAH